MQILTTFRVRERPRDFLPCDLEEVFDVEDVSPSFRRAWVINLRGSDDPANGNGAAGPSDAAGYPAHHRASGVAGGVPIGMSFMARAWQESTLLRFASALEQIANVRRPPRFVELPFVNR
ncbi:MAG TPA: hypothetical protein VFI59_00500 [Actinomycetota bacterium]|nr:hypothetical protein [Actinomycetota bacterium]